MRDVTVGQVAEAVVTIDFFYEEGDAGKYPPVVRDIDVRNVTSKKSQYAFLLRGYTHAPISGVRVADCRFDGVEKPDVIEAVRDLELTNVSHQRQGLQRASDPLTSLAPARVLGVNQTRRPRPHPGIAIPALGFDLREVVAHDAVAAGVDGPVGADLVEPCPRPIAEPSPSQPADGARQPP